MAKWQLFKKYSILYVGAAGLVWFQNCSPSDLGFAGFRSGSVLTARELALMSTSPGARLYALNCAECHGPLSNSERRGRSAAQITLAINSVTQMSKLKTLSSLDIAAISGALADNGNPIDYSGPRARYICNPNQVPESAAYKLTNREFKNSIRAVLNTIRAGMTNDGLLEMAINNIPADILYDGRHVMREQAGLLSIHMTKFYFLAAYRAGELVAATPNLSTFPNTNGCLGGATITPACHSDFIREFGSIAFRRPLAPAEVTDLSQTFWDGSLSKADLLTLTVAGMLQLPDFMYKVFDRGPASPLAANAINLTAHEIATKMAYFLTGSPPDQALRALADSGALMNNATLATEVDRLMSLPSAPEVIVRLFRETYGYDLIPGPWYSLTDQFLAGQRLEEKRFYPNGIDYYYVRIGDAIREELDRFFPDTVLGNGTFQTLFTSRQAYIGNDLLGQLYGVGEGVQTLPEHRAGFINRAAILQRRAEMSTTPVQRGLVILEKVLCEETGPPPANAPTAVPAEPDGSYLTTRERFHKLQQQPGTACNACHTRINNLGYPFEIFDSLGRFRTTEKIFGNVNGTYGVAAELPINAATTTLELKAEAVNVSDAVALGRELGNNDKAMICFTRHIKRFEGRRQLLGGDGCQMNAALDAMYGSNGNQGSIRDALKAYILSDRFKLWGF